MRYFLALLLVLVPALAYSQSAPAAQEVKPGVFRLRNRPRSVAEVHKIAISLTASAYTSVALGTGLSFFSVSDTWIDVCTSDDEEEQGNFEGLFCIGIPFLFGLGIDLGGLGYAAVAPSLGHLKAREPRGALTIALRLGAAGAVAVGAFRVFLTSEELDLENGALLFGGGAALVGLSLYDLLDAPAGAREAGRLSLAPVLMPGERASFGLGLGGRF
jgi:hypothetical protein